RREGVVRALSSAARSGRLLRAGDGEEAGEHGNGEESGFTKHWKNSWNDLAALAGVVGFIPLTPTGTASRILFFARRRVPLTRDDSSRAAAGRKTGLVPVFSQISIDRYVQLALHDAEQALDLLGLGLELLLEEPLGLFDDLLARLRQPPGGGG